MDTFPYLEEPFEIQLEWLDTRGHRCPQEVLEAPSEWPDGLYEAVPSGFWHKHFFEILPNPVKDDRGCDDSMATLHKIFRVVFEETKGLIIHCSGGIHNKSKPMFVVLLGSPGQKATDEQKLKVLELMKLPAALDQIIEVTICSELSE